MAKKSFYVNVEFDAKKCAERIKKRLERVQKVLDAQVLKDSNVYCPMQTGSLQKSGILNTVLGTGRVKWVTPYARKQYFEHPNKSRQYNPRASMQWFEAAKAQRLKVWEKLVNDEYNRNT